MAVALAFKSFHRRRILRLVLKVTCKVLCHQMYIWGVAMECLSQHIYGETFSDQNMEYMQHVIYSHDQKNALQMEFWSESVSSWLVCSVVIYLLYMLECRTVYALARGLFWWLFINTKITLEWVHKEFVTRVHILHFLHDITNPWMTIKTAIFTHRPRVSLVAYSAQSHYLNQCWDIVNWTLGNTIQWNFNQNTKLFIHENASEIIVCETVAILSRGRRVNVFARYIRPYFLTVALLTLRQSSGA